MPQLNSLESQQNDASFANIWQELKWRGLVHVSTDEAELEKLLSGDPITYYCGFDPTAPSLHLGNLVQLLVLRRLQLAGHRPLGLVGGSTGLIGDPRPTAERTLNTKDTVNEWVGYLQGQVSRFLSFEGANPARIVNNLDWTAPLSAIDFLREIGKHFRVGTMLRKDAVASRLNSEEGISYTEFSYQILQGMDYLQLFRDYDCVLQTGGSDQWGNLTSGTELIRKVEGKSVHALGTPLITNADGSKFGKSEGNAIWLDPAMCSPYAFYQFWVNTADADVVDRLKIFTFLSRTEIESLAQEVADRPFAREGQRRLAFEVTSLVHGVEATEKVIAASAAVFGNGDLSVLDEDTLAAATSELPSVAVDRAGLGIIDLLVASGLSDSKSAARRTVGEGGAYVNNAKISDPEAVVDASQLLHGKYLLLRKGKKNLATVQVA
ncbi:tyrosine--tRNA ligase [Pseudarthrobacter sp. J75]|uniref:tyrosine--tRNA ligase n=1 Tax=unclassified Pseudarthrobacter TaxID=2647000 RepID=UPI002E80B24D|nr:MULTISPECIES: tyrosine--tRNA ligase [unclassified Pseudarthrobacter]MEE2521882.1 tyrosine--tRNA ligase [Pseudarthrobacter sp. J47]MEE2527959.1 tyrosine--tRNA ligase [Pseudarthrobacter sp. J75]MEE2527961.1 tyrosine--tRNA ligase [Pseudarthrobacter sp. J75]